MGNTELVPESYRSQDGCHNCRCVELINTGDEVECYCGKRGPARPKYAGGTWEQRDAHIEALFQWASGRDVSREGICDLYERV